MIYLCSSAVRVRSQMFRTISCFGLVLGCVYVTTASTSSCARLAIVHQADSEVSDETATTATATSEVTKCQPKEVDDAIGLLQVPRTAAIITYSNSNNNQRQQQQQQQQPQQQQRSAIEVPPVQVRSNAVDGIPQVKRPAASEIDTAFFAWDQIVKAVQLHDIRRKLRHSSHLAAGEAEQLMLEFKILQSQCPEAELIRTNLGEDMWAEVIEAVHIENLQKQPTEVKEKRTRIDADKIKTSAMGIWGDVSDQLKQASNESLQTARDAGNDVVKKVIQDMAKRAEGLDDVIPGRNPTLDKGSWSIPLKLEPWTRNHQNTLRADRGGAGTSIPRVPFVVPGRQQQGSQQRRQQQQQQRQQQQQQQQQQHTSAATTKSNSNDNISSSNTNSEKSGAQTKAENLVSRPLFYFWLLLLGCELY
eukprot:TRINITY_DN16687_c0_g5_i1.p1 TRINITY_DN16687_c0_g5~~TRINITY_DN16687_c0_g5_i1.p1  ORF type:complete len:418 (-),score=97.87 TRINITY_DN16687_c0_g5_i1:88-1341(-)